MKKHHINTRLILVFISAITFLTACNPAGNQQSETKWMAEEIKSPELKTAVTELRSKIHNTYSGNSDSAIIYSRQLIDLFHKAEMPYNEFNEYLKLCELYNSRKHDDINALKCYAEALKIMIKNNGRENDRPYFYIDMGNMLYNNGLYSHANKTYLKAIDIAEVRKDSFAIAVGLNNLALIYRNQGKYDSAITYFRTSLRIRRDMKPQLHAQSYMYLAKVFSEANKPDSVLYYIKLSRDAVKKQLLLPDSSTSKTIIRDLQINDASLMANYYLKKNNLPAAIQSYNQVLETTQSAQDWIAATSASYSIADIYRLLSDNKQATHYAENAFKLSQKTKDYSYALKTASLLSQLYKQDANDEKQNFYLKQTVIYTDSLQREENSADTHAADLLLIATHIDETLSNYQQKLSSTRKVIKLQTVGLTTLSMALIGLMIFLYYARKKRQLLKEEYNKEINAVKEEKSKYESAKMQSDTNMANNIDLLEPLLISAMRINKVYTRQNLSLADLADILDTNTSYLSNLINKQFKSNFNDYINSYRIAEACEIFKSNDAHKLSIDQVADMVGFSSRRTFYLAFKKFTGLTPALYQNNLKNGQNNLPTD